VEIAESCGAKVVQFDFNGTWPKKKTWALENLPLANDWVLILDADEVLPAEAEMEIGSIVDASVESDIVGYFINRRFYFMGKWLKHAYYPNWILRLFRHGYGNFEKLTGGNTKSGDNEVHELIVLNGKSGHLKSEIEHYAFPTVDDFVEKHNRYSNWEARVAIDQNVSLLSILFPEHPMPFRRRLKLLSQKLPFRPLLRFLFVYVVQKGFLDGLEGYYFARLHGFYEFLSVIKLYELRKQGRTNSR
jgi:hypothetical protein